MFHIQSEKKPYKMSFKALPVKIQWLNTAVIPSGADAKYSKW